MQSARGNTGSNALFNRTSRKFILTSVNSISARRTLLGATSRLERIPGMIISTIRFLPSNTSDISDSSSSATILNASAICPCESRSTSNTFFPNSAIATPKWTVLVVLATPPFWFTTAITFDIFRYCNITVSNNRDTYKRTNNIKVSQYCDIAILKYCSID